MEQKILFLILALLGLYLILTPNGRTYLKKYIGINVQPL
jgi:hypothetical protein